MVIDFNNVESLGYFGWTIEEKFTKELKKSFPKITNYTSYNLYNLFKSAIKQYSRVPSNVVDTKIFEDFMYTNSGIDRSIINKFLLTANTFINSGIIDIKKINPNLTKSTWQYYLYPILGIAALIAGAKIITEFRRLKTSK